MRLIIILKKFMIQLLMIKLIKYSKLKNKKVQTKPQCNKLLNLYISFYKLN